MKKFNLDLKKQSVIELKDTEVATVYGGGCGRSQRKGGRCKYSRKHPVYAPNNPDQVAGCAARKTVASSSSSS